MKPKTYQLQHLTGLRQKVIRAVGDRLIPPTDGMSGGGSLESTAMLDWSLGRLEPAIRNKFLLLLVVIQVLGIFFGGRVFTANSPRTQDRQLRWMENNKIQLLRLGFFGLNTFVKMGHYTREANFSHINYSGPLFPDKPYVDPTVRKISQGEINLVP
jgi:hypothetical protein